MKIVLPLISIIFLSANLIAQTGIINDGSVINIGTNAVVYIDGNSDGDFTNKTSGANDGKIILDGTIIIEGDWNNNATSDSVLIDVDENGLVKFIGSSAQTIGGTNPTYYENLTIDNSNNITINENIIIKKTLTLTDGLITTGSDTVIIENTDIGAIASHDPDKSINGHLSIDNSNVFSNPNDASQTNTYNGIFVHGQDIISHSPTWQETEVAYVIQYDGFEIWDTFSLTLGDNVVLKFVTGAMFDIQIGAGLINNQGVGVFFTSFKDDGHKGDTNGDANATTPTATEWSGIYNNKLTDYFYTWSNILFSKNDF